MPFKGYYFRYFLGLKKIELVKDKKQKYKITFGVWLNLHLKKFKLFMEIKVNISMNGKTKSINLVLFTILCCATILRLYHLDFQSAWLDEIHTLKESYPKLPLKEFNEIIMFREGIPHFYFLTIRFLATIFGHGIFICRMVSAISGIASVGMIYLVGKELLNQRAGYIAAILLTVNMMHIEYSQEARSYAMLTFFILIAVYRLLVLLRELNYKNAIILGICTGLITNAQPVGLLNVGLIFVTLFIVLLSSKTKEERKKIFLLSSVAGIFALIVFSPVYRIVAKAADYKSFWVEAPTAKNIKQVFIDLMGKTPLLFWCYIALIGLFVFYSLFLIIKKNQSFEKRKVAFGLMFLILWVLLDAGVLIVKSYGPTSMILDRYFIGVLPAFILMAALGLAHLPSKYMSNALVLTLTTLSLYTLLIKKEYYTKITKSQFDKVTDVINENNKNHDKIISSWGWLMCYYLDRDNTNMLVTEMDLSSYLTSVRNNAMAKESFWYLDGNSKPISISWQDQIFLDENYTLKENVEKYDAWTRHYEYKKQSQNEKNLDLFVNQFMPYNSDGSGNLMLYESTPAKSPQIQLNKGKYELTINGNSLPAQSIQGINAHMIVKVNDQVIANYFLSEKTDNKEKKISFEWSSDTPARITLFFDNDIAINGLDRNIVIYSLKLKEQK